MNNLVDLKGVGLLGVSILPQTLSAVATTNGTAVDCQLTDGSIHGVMVTGNCGDSTLTLTVLLTESDTSSGTFTAVTGGAFTVYTGATLADNLAVAISTVKRSKRWVRAEVTLAGGGTLSVPISVLIIGRLKMSGSGGGYVS